LRAVCPKGKITGIQIVFFNPCDVRAFKNVLMLVLTQKGVPGCDKLHFIRLVILACFTRKV